MSIGNNHSTIMVRRKRAEKARIAVISREFRRHSGLLSRAKVHGMLAFSLGEGPRGKVRGLAGGQGGIRTRGGCYTTHAFQACALNHSATCPTVDWTRSAALITWPQAGAMASSPRPAAWLICLSHWGRDGPVSGPGVDIAGHGRGGNRQRLPGL